MTWGALFQQAWAAGTELSRHAARQAGTSPESAAVLLSDGVAHTFKRLLYADQDVKRETGPEQAPPREPMDAETMAGVTTAVADVEAGRVPPEAAQSHVQQAARQAAAKMSARAKPAAELSASGPGVSQRPKQDEPISATQRLTALSALFDAQLANIDAVPTDDVCGVLAMRVGALFDSCRPLFVAAKSVDSPIAPPRANLVTQDK